MQLTLNAGAAAVELYRMVAGEALDDGERGELEAMLALDGDGRWASPRVPVFGGRLLVARALAGMFLLDEDVMWSSFHYQATADAFDRMRTLVDGAEALRLQVANVRAVKGGQGIKMRSGRRLLFVTHLGTGGRGLSADCHLLDERSLYRDDPTPLAQHGLAGRPNPQLVIRL